MSRVLFETKLVLAPDWFPGLLRPAGGAPVPAPGEGLGLALGEGDGDVDEADGEGDADVGLLDGDGGGAESVGGTLLGLGFAAGQDGLTIGVFGLIDVLW